MHIAVTNFEDIAKRLNRPVKHIVIYICDDLGINFYERGDVGYITRNLDETRKNTIKEEIIESIKRYIRTYIICPQCKYYGTSLNSKMKIVCPECNKSKTIV